MIECIGETGKFRKRVVVIEKKRERVRSVENEKEREHDRNEECRGEQIRG